MVEARTKVTKEILCEEARFILANVMAEARYGRQNRYDDIRRVCEGAVSIPFTEYVTFLESAGYLRHDHESETLEVTKSGEKIVNGSNLSDLTTKAVAHFKSARARGRRKDVSDKRSSFNTQQTSRAPPPASGPWTEYDQTYRTFMSGQIEKANEFCMEYPKEKYFWEFWRWRVWGRLKRAWIWLKNWRKPK